MTNHDDKLHNKDAERAVLGAMMVDKAVIPGVMTIIKSTTAFVTTDHQLIYNAITDCYEKDGVADPVTVATRLERTDDLNRAGRAVYLYDLQDLTVETESTEQHAQIVRELANRRSLKALGKTIDANASDQDLPINRIYDDAHQQILDLSQGAADNKTASEPLTSTIKPTLDWIEAIGKGEMPAGLNTGFHALDGITSGFQPGNFIVIAARPGMGKSALAVNIAQNVATNFNLSTLIFSLEMTKREITTRILSSESGIPFRTLRRGQFDPAQTERLADTVSRLLNRKPQVILNDNRSIDIQSLRVEARRIHAERDDLALIVVDYLQLMRPSAREQSRERQVAEMSAELKTLAGDLNIPIIACSQFNRESRKQGRAPEPHELRDSGAIEQDADIVAILHRQNTDDDQASSSEPRLTELRIRKNRNGPEGDIHLMFYPNTISFTNTPDESEVNHAKQSTTTGIGPKHI